MDLSTNKTVNPASLISFKHTNQGAYKMHDLYKYKNLVKLIQAELDLSGNCFESEIKELSSLRFLRKLSLSSNHIKELWQFPKTLEVLNVSCNHLATISELKLPRLQYLDFSCNLLTSLQGFSELPVLKSLSLGYNLLKNLEGLENMKSLMEIDIEHNLLTRTEDLNLLIRSSVLVFVLRNNPGSR